MARHETSGAGSPDSSNNSSKRAYGTRSKRKAPEMSGNDSETPAPEVRAPRKRTRTRGSKKSTAAVSKTAEPPTKKLRSTTIDPELAPKLEQTPTPSFMSQTTPETAEDVSIKESSDTPPSQEAPQVIITNLDASEATTPDVDFANGATPITWDELPASQEPDVEEPTASPAKRGRGGWRRGKGRKGAKPKAKVLTDKIAIPLPTIPNLRKTRGGRRKATVNPRIDALNLRTSELKGQFADIAKAQRIALAILADKSAEMISKDPVYHESVPEFDEVSQALKEFHERRQEAINVREKLDIGLAENSRKWQEKMVEDQFNDRVEDAEDSAFARIKEHAMYVWHQFLRGDPLDELPIPEASEEDPAKMFGVTTFPVVKETHPFANPFWKPELATPSPFTEGDTQYYQHPANYYKTLDAKARHGLRKDRKIMGPWVKSNSKSMTGEAKLEENSSSRSAKSKSLLKNGVPKPYRIRSAEEAANTNLDLTSTPRKAATRRSKQTASKVSVQTWVDRDFDSSPEPDQSEDEMGVSVINGNLRIPPPFKFDEDEIGMHTMYTSTQAGKLKYEGMSRSNNPDFFHIPQMPVGAMAGDCIGRLREGEFDEKTIKAYGLHPKYGIALATSTNPDQDELEEPLFPAPTDSSKPLPNPRSQRVVEIYADGTRKMFRANRNWIQEVDTQWEQNEAKVKMYELLNATNNHEVLNPNIAKKQRQPMNALAEACKAFEAADAQAEADAKAQAKLDYEARLAREKAEKEAALKTTPTYPSRSQYDPVRDTTYQTPYPRTVPAPRPAQHAPYRQGSNLAMLADMAMAPSIPTMKQKVNHASVSYIPKGTWTEPPVISSQGPPTHLLQGPPAHLLQDAMLFNRMADARMQPPPPPPQPQIQPHHHPQTHLQAQPQPPHPSQPHPQTHSQPYTHSHPPPNPSIVNQGLPLAPQGLLGQVPNNFFGHIPIAIPVVNLLASPNRGRDQGLRPLQPAPPRGGRRTSPPTGMGSSTGNNRGGWYGSRG